MSENSIGMQEPPSTPSPLEEADPLSLDEFLSRDPFEYTKLDRHKVIRLLREQRMKWDQLESQGKRLTKGAAKGAVKEAPKAIELDELFENET